MNDKKPGIIRRFFQLLGKITLVLRTLINLLILVVFITLLASLFQKDTQPLPERAALRVAPTGMIVEERTYTDPLSQLLRQSSQLDSETLLRDLVDAINAAAQDKRITSLVLELDYLLGGGISKLEEIGQALENFKASGKPVIAVGDSFTQDQYFLASYADEIHLNPMGAVLLTGYGSYPYYLHSALQKLKVNVNVFRVGEYKDAIEPFVRDDMSSTSREHTLGWLNTLWDIYTSRVENLRNIPSDAINDYVNNMERKLLHYNGDSAALALATGLVDRLSSRPEMLARLREQAGAENHNSYRHVDFKPYVAHIRRARGQQPATDKIGLIIAKGPIFDGEQPRGSIGGDSLAALIRQARLDQRVKALVLRVDSPGGSAFAADIIRQEIIATQAQGIPVIVSMGSLAASGGYWISANADQIWATPTTLTGSIGVFGIVPTFEDSLMALGINSDGVGTTDLADAFHLDRPMSEKAKILLQLNVDNIYDRFLALVAEGRDSTPEAIHKIAQGRVWSGLRAKELGLVDELGSLQDAIAAAAKLSNLEQYQLEIIKQPLNFYEQLAEKLAASGVRIPAFSSTPAWLPQHLLTELKPFADKLDVLQTFNDPRGIYVKCLLCMNI